MNSRYLNSRALTGLSRLGDVMLPGGEGMPRFSATGCLEHLDTLLQASHPDDVRDLGRLLWLVSLAPSVMLRGLLRLLDRAEQLPAPLAGGLRLLNVGLKGVILSLYYSGLTGTYYTDSQKKANAVHAAMGYELVCTPDAAIGVTGAAADVTPPNATANTAAGETP